MNQIAKWLCCTLLVWVSSAWADEAMSFNFDGCVDSAGHHVQAKADPSLRTLLSTVLEGGNAAGEGGVPVIHYNPSLVPQLLPETRAFLFAHECAWSHLKMPVAGTRTAEQAQRADCWAAGMLVRSRLIGRDNLAAIESDLEMAADQQALLPQPARKVDLKHCAPVSTAAAGKSGTVVGLPAGTGNARWDACTQACGSTLYHCGRSSGCTKAFEQCVAGCDRRTANVKAD